MKKARRERTNAAGFHFNKVPKAGKFTEKNEWWWPGAGGGRKGSCCSMGAEFQVYEMRRVVGTKGSAGCTEREST